MPFEVTGWSFRPRPSLQNLQISAVALKMWDSSESALTPREPRAFPLHLPPGLSEDASEKGTTSFGSHV